MAHDACGEEGRRSVLRGEQVRRATRLSGKLTKDVQRRLIVFYDAVCPVGGTARDGAQRRRKDYLVLSRMNVSPHRWYSSLMVDPRKARETCKNVIMASHFRILFGRSIMSPMYSPMEIARIV